jgi:predicted DNA-binding protein YlxM (UPF0122 family)
VLDDISRMIIKTYFFDKAEMSVVVQRAFMVRSAVYKRIEKAVEMMEYYIANTAKA